MTDWTKPLNDDGSPKDWCERVEAFRRQVGYSNLTPENWRALWRLLADGKALARELSNEIHGAWGYDPKRGSPEEFRIKAMQHILKAREKGDANND